MEDATSSDALQGRLKVGLPEDQISEFVYQRYVKPALEAGRSVTLDAEEIRKAIGDSHTSDEIRRVIASRTFRQLHGLLLESATDLGTGLVYTFRLDLRRS
jgi:hypothetical protein